MEEPKVIEEEQVEVKPENLKRLVMNRAIRRAMKYKRKARKLRQVGR